MKSSSRSPVRWSGVITYVPRSDRVKKMVAAMKPRPRYTFEEAAATMAPVIPLAKAA